MTSSPTTAATPARVDAAATGGRTALVTGASGYIGGQLVPRLLDTGWSVKVLTRRRASLDDRPWIDRVEVVEGDVSSSRDMRAALTGVDAAWYLVHSMDDQPDFEKRDREAATTFAEAAAAEGVSRIVYLGGLHPDDEVLSPHLASRVEVGRIFLDAPVPAAVLQAAVVLGDGSASFDMLRYLTTRLPAMVAPKWLDNKIQPIAVDDVMTLLAGAGDLPPEVNRTFDIGGDEVLTYREMIGRFSDATGRRRPVVVTVPVLTPRLASHWVGLVTPISAGLAKPLVGSLVHEVVAKERDIDDYVDVPGGYIDFDTAVQSAMRTAKPDTALRNLALTSAATVATAVVGSLATQPNSSYYRSLELPDWQPPAAAFPVVWTALYADIAASSATALNAFDKAGDAQGRSEYLKAFGTNLAINAAWSAVFWRSRRPWAAAAHAALLTASSADLARRAGQASKGAGIALSPYAVWCGFATVLSAAIARRNPR
ncbi:MAG TPA: tryptophan-rich sensory protein [Humibacillus xanthopallidus]|nr:tryptophan-rich sensory protein [Humibacillus xanthopallidus]